MEDNKIEAIVSNYKAVVKAFNDGEIPFCFKALLTVEETAHYTGIGLNKLRVILADNPDLEFRYCSKCAGYHCYCQDHIFNHVHFTE